MNYVCTLAAPIPAGGSTSVDLLVRAGYATTTTVGITVTATEDASGDSASAIVTIVDPCASYRCVYLVDPGAAAGTNPVRLVDDASDPAYGTTGEVAFERGGTLRRIAAGGGPDVQLTPGPADGAPDLAGSRLVFTRPLPADTTTQTDVLLLDGAAGSSVAANVEFPSGTAGADLRADILLDCAASIDSPLFLVGVAVPPSTYQNPTATAPGGATFEQRLDPTLSCPDGRLTVLVNDGFLRSTPTSGASTDIVATPKPPDAAIYGLPDGASRLDWQSVPLRGSGKDPEDGELIGSSLQWVVTGPCPSASPCGAPTVLTATGTASDVRPSGGRWATGWYQEELTVTDSTARTDVSRSWFLVQADADIDGIPAPLDRASCTNGAPSGASLDSDPTNASGDLDGDGIPNGADPAPCVAATERLATIVLDPMTLYVPSRGNVVTTYISVTGSDMRLVSGSSIRIERINGEDPGAPSVAACKVTGGLPATAYTATASTGTAKFDRQKLNGFLSCMGFVGRVDQIYITGAAPSGSPPWTFSGITFTDVRPGS